MADKPGRLYARVLRNFEGRSPVPFWLAASDPPPDTRLAPGQIDEALFEFPTTLSRLRLRVLYRRFWPQAVRAKRWPDRDLLVLEQEFMRQPKELAP